MEGVGGEETFCLRAGASPAAPPEYLEGGTEQKFPFPFLIFFQGGAQKKNCKGKFLRGCRRSEAEAVSSSQKRFARSV